MLSPTLTVLVLAVLWLIVVVPMLFRRPGRRRRGRSVAVAAAVLPAVAVPAAQEALMYPVDRPQISAARARMMARRRRSLGTLAVGTVVLLAAGWFLGGLLWLPGLGFAAGLVGYLGFLRGQARRARDRRERRLGRAGRRRGGFSSGEAERPEEHDADLDGRTVVAIDDDDLQMQEWDTMDLTGLYVEAGGAEGADADLGDGAGRDMVAGVEALAERRAS